MKIENRPKTEIMKGISAVKGDHTSDSNARRRHREANIFYWKNGLRDARRPNRLIRGSEFIQGERIRCDPKKGNPITVSVEVYILFCVV